MAKSNYKTRKSERRYDETGAQILRAREIPPYWLRDEKTREVILNGPFYCPGKGRKIEEENG